MLKHSDQLERQALQETKLTLRLTLTSTITTKNRGLRFLERKYRTFTIKPIEPGIIDWISVTIPAAGIKETVYRPQTRTVLGRIRRGEEEDKRPPINVKVKGVDFYRVSLVLYLKRWRWISPPARNSDTEPDMRAYPLNWTLDDKDDETSFYLDYGYIV
jgi:hypothetical protein